MKTQELYKQISGEGKEIKKEERNKEIKVKADRKKKKKKNKASKRKASKRKASKRKASKRKASKRKASKRKYTKKIMRGGADYSSSPAPAGEEEEGGTDYLSKSEFETYKTGVVKLITETVEPLATNFDVTQMQSNVNNLRADLDKTLTNIREREKVNDELNANTVSKNIAMETRLNQIEVKLRWS